MPDAFPELNVDCEERDARYLAGGNFFGAEEVGPPPRDPVPSIQPSVAEAASAAAIKAHALARNAAAPAPRAQSPGAPAAR